MSTKMRVLLSFEYNDIDPGSKEEEIIVETIERLTIDLREVADRVSVHDVQFYSTDIGSWI